MSEDFPFDLRLEPAPYRFEWTGEQPVSCHVRRTPHYSEERYDHADGTVVVIRNYFADGSFHVLSDRGEIEVVDRARDPRSPLPVSVVKLP